VGTAPRHYLAVDYFKTLDPKRGPTVTIDSPEQPIQSTLDRVTFFLFAHYDLNSLQWGATLVS